MQSIVLDKFDYGIISNPDQEDISDKAAVSSLNIDGDNEDGKLKGIPTSLEFTTTGTTSIADIRQGVLVVNDSIYDLVYHDSNANKIKRVADVYNATGGTVSDLKSSIADTVCMVVNNKEVHIGVGNSSTDYPQWVGFPGHQLFGGIDHVGRSTSPASAFKDMWAGGNYTGTSDKIYRVQIDSNGTPDTFKWSDDDGATWEATGINVTTSEYTLAEGIKIKFQATTGHNLNEYFRIHAKSSSTFVIENAELTTQESLGIYGASLTTIGLPTPASGYFTAGIRSRYKFSLIYDGYQESPLSTSYVDHYDAVNEYSYLQVPIKFDFLTGSMDIYSARLTGVNLYRADSTDSSEENFGLYKLVRNVNLVEHHPNCNYIDSGIYKNYALGGTMSATDYDKLSEYYTSDLPDGKIVIVKDEGEVGASYQDNSGMPSNSTTSIVHYTLSTKGNGYHFVAKGYHPDIEDADNWIFRSKELRFDMFDYVNDFLVMPRTPTALEFYEGKLYVFDQNNMYRINPEGLYIEDVITGVGARGQRSVLQTAYGLFFCNDNGAYRYAGGQVEPISERIKVSSSGGVNWATLVDSTITDTIVKFDSLKNYVLFIGTDSSYNCIVWAYHVIKNRWDYWNPTNGSDEFLLDGNSGAFTGKDGEIYVSNATKTFKILRSGTLLSWIWRSKEFNLDNPSQNKWWGKILSDPTSGITLTYGTEGASPVTAYTHGTNLDIYKKSLQLNVTGTAGTEVDSIEILVRKLIGLR